MDTFILVDHTPVNASLGGAWFPFGEAGKTFAATGHLMTTAWAKDGFHSIILRGLGFRSIILPAGVMTVYAVIFFALAIWRFEVRGQR